MHSPGRSAFTVLVYAILAQFFIICVTATTNQVMIAKNIIFYPFYGYI